MYSISFSRILALVRKDLRLEFRNAAALGELFLYVVSTVFVCYRSFISIANPGVWNALFWIIILFASVNAVSRSFIRESKSHRMYYYQLASPGEIILSKIIFNYLLIISICLITIPVYSVLLGDLIQDKVYFLITVILSAGAFSSCLTLVSAIASKTENGAGLTAVLSFPLVIPLLLTALKASKNALDGIDPSVYLNLILVLGMFNLIIAVLSFILFPYLWRD